MQLGRRGNCLRVDEAVDRNVVARWVDGVGGERQAAKADHAASSRVGSDADVA